MPTAFSCATFLVGGNSTGRALTRPAAWAFPPRRHQRPVRAGALLSAVAGVAAAFLAAGCQTTTTQPAARASNGAQPVGGAARGDGAGVAVAPGEGPAATAPAGSIDPRVLAERVRAHSEAVEAAAAAQTGGRRAEPAAPAPRVAPGGPVAAAEPSKVDFMDPDDVLRLSPTIGTRSTSPGGRSKPAARPVPEARVVPFVKTIVDSTPSAANQKGSIADENSPGPGAAALSPDRTAAVQLASNREQDIASLLEGGSAADAGAGRGAGADAATAGAGGDAGGAFELSLARRAKDNPREVWAHLDYQMIRFLHDRQVPEMESLAPLPAEDKEMISGVMDALTLFRNALRADNNLLPSRKVRPLLDLADRLRGLADLNVPTLALCTKVDGFGVYDPIDPARFAAGKEHPVLVYCEVENFASQVNDKKLWQTKLSQEAVLYTETGMMVWQDKSKSMVDLSRNRRHDFYVVKLIRLPANLTIGRYLLKVSIVDQQASRIAEATTPVQIVAQP